ncbi:hypothetical protein ACTFQ5_20955 [Aliivibrio fischeri]|uniref:hypothetical protein n=1 Tax=Aliivibrio fischeri TaxID=668 RepID=UPI0007C55397|nr:hypothetical protein [Aliivibrio fischeri]MBP3139112.1 DUF2845 domain-containing protein [Aliivibrio fischeri]
MNIWLVLTSMIVTLLVVIFIEKRRKNYLLSKYMDEYVVEQILKNRIWQGQTKEEVEDSIGLPVKIERTVFKHNITECWKYKKRKGEYSFLVLFENGEVVGWHEK